MGRKIPGRKHHGVKDPAKQRAATFKKIKDKINAPPANPDEQHIPKSLKRLAELRDKAKNIDFKRKTKKKGQSENKFPGGFIKRPSESDHAFLLRVHRKVDAVKREAAFEEKFGVEIKRNKYGRIESVEKRPKDPVQIMIKEAKQEKKNKKRKKPLEDRLTKTQKRQLKFYEKKQKKIENSRIDDFDKFKDEVKFGEQVHAPPTLTLPKKAAKTGEAQRPGQKDLLLKSILNPPKTSNKIIDKKGKRKDLPNALRRQLDKQQQEVIQVYRNLKQKKT